MTPEGLGLFIDGVPVTFTINGKTITTITDPTMLPSPPHHLVCQTDMGPWAGSPTSKDPTRMELVVESIKQYRYAG